jgi:tripeptidyl-peptidase-1
LIPFTRTSAPVVTRVGVGIPLRSFKNTDFATGKLQCGIYKPTNVISASYGQAEADLPIAYTKRQCNEFLKLGLQGHSILFASGDYGVASFAGDGSANGCLGPDSKIFNPQYPSNCPYVTSVGGTMLYGDQTVKDAESVMHANLGGTATNFSSAGGFSNYFPQPAYQKEAVKKYFEKADLSYPYYSEFSVDFNTTKGLYNRIGRAYPDVAANGAMFRAYTDGYDYHYYGSSLASPLFASVLNLVYFYLMIA